MWGPEDTIQVGIMAWLDAVLPDAFYYHVPNGGLRTANTARKLKRLGVLPGVPDIVVVLPAGRTLYIEVKAPKGTLSSEQRAFRARAEALGHVVVVARSIDEARAGLANAGVATREAVAA